MVNKNALMINLCTDFLLNLAKVTSFVELVSTLEGTSMKCLCVRHSIQGEMLLQTF